MGVEGFYFLAGDSSHEAVFDTEEDLGVDVEGGIDEKVEGVKNGSVGGIFNGDDAVIAVAADNLVKDVGDIWLWRVGDGVAEFFDRCLVCPGAFGAEVGDFEVVLERESGGHDLTVDGLDGFFREASFVELEEAVEESLLTLWGVNLEAIALFDNSDFMDEISTLGEEVEEIAVDEVDLLADVVEAHGVSSEGVSEACSSGSMAEVVPVAEKASCFSCSCCLGESSVGSGSFTRRSSEAFGRSSMELMPKCSKKSSVVW